MDDLKELNAELDNHIDLFNRGSINTAGDVDFYIKKTIDQIGRYIQSKYLGGMVDKTTGKRLRFRNIGNAIVDLETRAKNIDRKAIEATALDGDYTFSMVVNKELQKWMKLNNFGKVIDDYQRKKTEYGSVMMKKTIQRDKDNKRQLLIEPIQWSYAKVNARDIENGIKMDSFEMSPMELMKRTDVWDKEKVIEAILSHDKVKEKGQDIEVQDIEGEFSKEYFEEMAEEDEYQTAIYNIIRAKIGDKTIILHYDELKESRFKYDKRKAVEGSDWGVGVWQELFEPQIAINEAVIAEADAMDIAGKVIIKTNKQTNIPSALSLVNGEMIELEEGEYMDSMSLAPTALPLWNNIMNDWFTNMQRDQSSYAGITGEQPHASTPFASLALQSAQSSSIFNKRRDTDGYFLNEILMDWVLPFIVNGINKEHELTAAFSPMELKKIDKVIQTEYNNEMILAQEGVVLPPKMVNLEQELSMLQGERTLQIPKGYITIEKIQKKLRFDITGEMSDSQRELNALATRLQSLPPEDPARREIINQMGEIAGISSATLGAEAVPQQQPQGAGGNVPQAQAPNKIQVALPNGQR